MPTIEIEVEIYCSCGEGLCGQSKGTTSRYSGSSITVELCEKCLDNAHTEGYNARDGEDE